MMYARYAIYEDFTRKLDNLLIKLFYVSMPPIYRSELCCKKC